MHGSLVFTPGMCSDDGRALTGWWNLYTRRKDAYKNEFWNGALFFNTKEEAEEYSKNNNIEIISTGAC